MNIVQVVAPLKTSLIVFVVVLSLDTDFVKCSTTQRCWTCDTFVDQNSNFLAQVPENRERPSDAHSVAYPNLPPSSKSCIREGGHGDGLHIQARYCAVDDVCAVTLEHTVLRSTSFNPLYPNVYEIWHVKRDCVTPKDAKDYDRGLCTKDTIRNPGYKDIHGFECICDGAHLCNDWTFTSLRERFYARHSYLDNLRIGDTVEYPSLPISKRKIMGSPTEARIKCYRCKANLHYQGGGWRNETNADCDGKRKYVMDEKYRNPDECAMGEWCSMSLTHKVAASGWKDLYLELERGCTGRAPAAIFGRGCYSLIVNFDDFNLQTLYCSCYSNYCNDWMFEGLLGRYNGTSTDYLDRSPFYVRPTTPAPNRTSTTIIPPTIRPPAGLRDTTTSTHLTFRPSQLTHRPGIGIGGTSSTGNSTIGNGSRGDVNGTIPLSAPSLLPPIYLLFLLIVSMLLVSSC